MELDQLKIFTELAKREHLNRTARELSVSASSISTSISRLEKELGVRLFDRIGRNIRLNDYGRAYLKHIENALDGIKCGEQELNDLLKRKNKKLVIAAANAVSWHTSVQNFSRMYPDVVIKYVNYDPLSSHSSAPPSDVDIVIASPESFSHPEWDSQLLLREKIVLAVAREHAFAARKSIALSEARNEWFVALSDSSFQRKCVELCREAGFEPKSRIECDDMLRPSVVAGENMVCLTTLCGKRAGAFSSLSLIPLTDEGAVRDQSIFWRHSDYMPQPVRLFKDYMIYLYQECGE